MIGLYTENTEYKQMSPLCLTATFSALASFFAIEKTFKKYDQNMYTKAVSPN